ncbi:protein of unknown function [Sphingomonas sp. YR710]|uniref:DUF4376 domain-containing protein n=1 Tax=Sphingomonas sp. YR710 TaxID=1882773 RepID=UPI00088472DD|nr:DUF4376 domain-containing protein [Sphingomonas sp. YR710]SDC49649.1 protein of unknown function [Sphingomonas sp. YR710]
MSLYAITRAGERPRLFAECASAEEAQRRCGDGEVAIPTTEAGDFVASADGRALIPYDFPLAIQKVARWNAVKVRRAAVAGGGVPTPFGTVDSDDGSLAKISGASLAAMMAQATAAPFSIDWTMADNAVARLDAAGMITMGQSVMAHVGAAYARARVLRDAVEAAADAEALAAIDIGTGWPPN